MAERRRQKKTKRGRSAVKASNTGDSDRPPERVTQSGRFTPEQMRVVERACAIKGWSVARLIERATCEKAAALVNVEQKDSSGFRFFARTLMDLLLNRKLVVEHDGLRVSPGYTEQLLGPIAQIANVEDIRISLDSEGSELQVAFSDESIGGLEPDLVSEASRFGVRAYSPGPEPDFVRDLRSLLVAAGSELAALLASAHDDYRAARTKREFLDPQALLGETDSGGPSPSGCLSDSSSTGEQP